MPAPVKGNVVSPGAAAEPDAHAAEADAEGSAVAAAVDGALDDEPVVATTIEVVAATVDVVAKTLVVPAAEIVESEDPSLEQDATAHATTTNVAIRQPRRAPRVTVLAPPSNNARLVTRHSELQRVLTPWPPSTRVVVDARALSADVTAAASSCSPWPACVGMPGWPRTTKRLSACTGFDFSGQPRRTAGG
jgi:hypothetical protein